MPNVYVNFGLPDARALGEISADEILALKKYGYFKAGSMLPKVEAAASFAKKGGVGIITDIESLKEALAGKAGTIIRK